MSRFGVLARLLVVTMVASAGACSGEGGRGGGAAGTGASSGGAGTGAGSPGAAGTGEAGSNGTGAAGTGAAGSATGAAGSATGASGMGAAGTAGSAGMGAAGTGAAGTGAAGTGAAGATPDAGTMADGGATDAGARGNKVLLYTRSTGFVHDSTVTAAAAIAKAAMAAGLVPETSNDPAKFASPAALAAYAGVVLIATAGEPFGSPGTTQVQTLIEWVRAGGGLVGIENANHAYDSNMAYIGLLGGHFNGHSALGPDFCYKDGDHPSVAKLTATWQVTDEIYNTNQFRMDNQVVLRCASDRRPISWVRQEGMGRVFYTSLGHLKDMWNNPPLVDGHVLPGLLWSMGRAVP
jgi:type 1 glutamine amidotransferase